MSQIEPEDVVSAAMQPLTDLDVPSMLRDSIDRQSRTLLGLATGLLKAGMNEQQVRVVIDRACQSYRDELVTAIITLRKSYKSRLFPSQSEGAITIKRTGLWRSSTGFATVLGTRLAISRTPDAAAAPIVRTNSS